MVVTIKSLGSPKTSITSTFDGGLNCFHFHQNEADLPIRGAAPMNIKLNIHPAASTLGRGTLPITPPPPRPTINLEKRVTNPKAIGDL